jgi:hypothetical protein
MQTTVRPGISTTSGSDFAATSADGMWSTGAVVRRRVAAAAMGRRLVLALAFAVRPVLLVAVAIVASV